jgi:geranylgeranyl pyrophosphate synthase
LFGCEAAGGTPEDAMPGAVALELIHTYSLVHDDLPAMDDDDLRRGQPTCHRAFDEATAILAGDALQTLGFELLCAADSVDAATRLALVAELATASGSRGMIGGQAVDVAHVGRPITAATLESMHALKTGALIRAALRMGALLGHAEPPALACLDGYARCIGLAFQVQDDILDACGDVAALGKNPGSDAAQTKPTYVTQLGESGARALALELRDAALATLAPLGQPAAALAQMAHFIVSRDR